MELLGLSAKNIGDTVAAKFVTAVGELLELVELLKTNGAFSMKVIGRHAKRHCKDSCISPGVIQILAAILGGYTRGGNT